MFCLTTFRLTMLCLRTFCLTMFSPNDGFT
jgi:hypothetical protein